MKINFLVPIDRIKIEIGKIVLCFEILLTSVFS